MIWDQHGCLPLRPEPDAVDLLDLYRDSGVSFVSINVGMDSTAPLDALKVLAAFRNGVRARSERFVLANTSSDVVSAAADGRLAVGFDLEGTEPLDGDLDMIGAFHDLGVRTMLMAYNSRNRAAGGCHDDEDTGLTDFGRAVVGEMNRATGGVIGINGVGIFLGDNDASTDALVRAVDYAVQLVGPEHVGLGLDYVFDREELRAFIAAQATFPTGFGYRENAELEFVSPSQMSELRSRLLGLSYGTGPVEAILGRNFLRVARTVWPG